MNPWEQVRAVLRGERPDRTPFVPDESCVPRGELTRQLRNRGMGLCRSWLPTYWSGRPHVSMVTQGSGSAAHTTWVTSSGAISQGPDESWLKTTEDYEPVIACIEDEEFYPDPQAYDYARRDLGRDGVIKVAGPSVPHEASFAFFDDRTPEARARWRCDQAEHPDRFARLLRALAAREERRISCIGDSPGEIICFAGIGDDCIGDDYRSEEFRRHVLPAFRQYVPRLRRPGRLTALRLETPHARAFDSLIGETGVDMVDGFVPAPYGDLSMNEARGAWGRTRVIWANLSHAVLHEEARAIRRYVLDILRDNRDAPLVLGMMPLPGIAGEGLAPESLVAGMTAVVDALEEIAARRSPSPSSIPANTEGSLP